MFSSVATSGAFTLPFTFCSAKIRTASITEMDIYMSKSFQAKTCLDFVILSLSLLICMCIYVCVCVWCVCVCVCGVCVCGVTVYMHVCRFQCVYLFYIE